MRIKPNAKNKKIAYQRSAGFSLLDLLLAMVILSIGITGLMRYQQTLLFQFSYLSESQQAWQLTSQILDIYPANLPSDLSHWHSAVEILSSVNECAIVKATVTSPKKIDVQLERFICAD